MGQNPPRRSDKIYVPSPGSMQRPVGPRTYPSMHAGGGGGCGCICSGIAVGAELTAATVLLPRTSPPSTAVTLRQRIITFRIMFPQF